jgi:hypothetical protein
MSPVEVAAKPSGHDEEHVAFATSGTMLSVVSAM